MVSGGTIVSPKYAVADCCGVLESVTWNVSGVNVPVTEGVPLSTPVEVLNVKPAGSVPVNCQV
jgi:hypothetical protein